MRYDVIRSQRDFSLRVAGDRKSSDSTSIIAELRIDLGQPWSVLANPPSLDLMTSANSALLQITARAAFS